MRYPESDDHNHHDHEEHDHSHEGHDHTPTVNEGNVRRIRFVFVLTAGYALIQAIGGWLSGSLALIADSGHMVSDAAALLLALIAYRVAARTADSTRTYGFHRVRVLAALANGAALLILVSWIVWEAIERFREPTDVLAGPMLAVAVIGLVVNIVGFLVLRMGSQNDSNLRGAFLHVIGDLLGSAGAIAAAIGILLTGWTVLDPILSVLVALLVVRSAWGLVNESIQVLLQATPRGLDATAVVEDLRRLPGVAEVGHFHAWTLTDETRIATVHVVPMPGTDPLSLPPLIAERLKESHSIEHATVQVDAPGNLNRCT
ncbi:cation efflux protein [Metapseudomonas resinovorans]|uniref:cation diffusion facilitator family transporter n=1 Tax=Metapseudomonas resinovorans TaxID=53412 RepID=UPI000987D04A|nr:cation diffusion facilitator family transporter [Pseudomonas resinovorans]GLZ88001.1 cation efflux protein [Pseudomonas resinovorans]